MARATPNFVCSQHRLIGAAGGIRTNLRHEEATRVMERMSRDGLIAESTIEELFEPGTKDVALARIYRAFVPGKRE